MGRDFKEEYTEYMAAQTPDLWGRIESELPVAKKRKKRFLRRYAPIGATAAILLIGVCAAPFYLGMFRFGPHDGAESKSADMAPQSAADVTSEGGIAGGDGAEYFVNGSSKREEESTAEDAADMAEPEEREDGAAASEAPETPAQGNQEAMLQDTQDAENKEKGAQESMTDDLAAVEDALGAKNQRQMRVKILSGGEEEENGRIRYRALEEESGEQIELLLSGETERQIETALHPGKVYLISACRQEDGYLILSAELER